MAKHDLTKRMSPFFDVHLIIPLMEFVEEKQIYTPQSIVEAQRKLLLKTNMIDSVMETYTAAKEQVPEELQMRRNQILEQREKIMTTMAPIVQILETDEVRAMMDSGNTRDRDSNNKILDHLIKNTDFHIDMLATVFRSAKFQYECGNYTASTVYLDYYRALVPHDHANYLSALFGKLASEILMQDWPHAKDELTKLRAYIDTNPFETELELLQHRAWLIHWGLYVYFNYPKGRDEMIDMCLNQQPYLNTIQVLCPHILRYISIAVVTSKHKLKNSLKELVKVIDMERHNYRDPITEFLTSLYIKYDFDDAQQKLRECEQVLSNDFFLTACIEDFRESARLLIFEMFCRIHQCISIKMLAEKLNMGEDEAERWIVDLIRNYRIEGAKIDSKLGQVVMSAKTNSLHEQIMENTKRLSFRTQQLALQLEKHKIEKKGAWKGDVQQQNPAVQVPS